MVQNNWLIYPVECIFNLVSPNSTIKSFFSKVIVPDMLVAFESVYNWIFYDYNWRFVRCYLLDMMRMLLDPALFW